MSEHGPNLGDIAVACKAFLKVWADDKAEPAVFGAYVEHLRRAVSDGQQNADDVAFEARTAARAAFAEAILRKLVEVPEHGLPMLAFMGGWTRADGTEVPYGLEDADGVAVELTATEATYVDLLRGEHA